MERLRPYLPGSAPSRSNNSNRKLFYLRSKVIFLSLKALKESEGACPAMFMTYPLSGTVYFMAGRRQTEKRGSAVPLLEDDHPLKPDALLSWRRGPL